MKKYICFVLCLALPAVSNLSYSQPPGGRGRLLRFGKGGPGQRGKASKGRQFLVLAYNNSSTMVRTQDGSLLLLYQKEGKVILRRYGAGGKGSFFEKILSEGPAGSIAIAGSGAGTIMAVWTQGRSLYASVSTDMGRTFAHADAIVSRAKDRTHAPSIRLYNQNGSLKAVVIYHLGNKDTGSVWSAVLSGGKWSSPVRVDKGKGSWAAIAGLGDKNIVIWKDFRAGGKSPELYTSVSQGEGIIWTEERNTGFHGADPGMYIDKNGWIHIGYQSGMKIWYTRSKDWGKTWEQPRKIGQDPGLFTHVAGNSMGQIVLSWERFTRRGSIFDDSIKTIGLAVSSDNGDTFKVVEPDVAETHQTRAAAEISDDGTINMVWVDRNTGKGILKHTTIDIRSLL